MTTLDANPIALAFSPFCRGRASGGSTPALAAISVLLLVRRVASLNRARLLRRSDAPDPAGPRIVRIGTAPARPAAGPLSKLDMSAAGSGFRPPGTPHRRRPLYVRS